MHFSAGNAKVQSYNLGGKAVSQSAVNRPPADVLARAQAGDAEAANEVGLWYAKNQPASPEVELWFRRAADAGLARAQHNMGVLTMQLGRTDQAIEWFKRAVDGGWRPSAFALGSLLEERGDKERAVEAFEIGAQQECPLSQDALGRLAFDEETEASLKVAKYWSEKSAQQGHAPAQTRLGTIFHEGLGVARDPQQAAFWFLQAAQRGHAGAQAMIGTAYHLGIGVEANRLRAARWLMASAAQGSPLAQAYLPRVEAELTADEKLVLKEEESSGHCMNVNGIELCGSYAGFERGIIRNYEADTPGLGYSAAYHEPEKGHATIYIYDKQLTGIPDGPDSPQAHQEFRRAIDEVATAPAGREIELIDTYGTESPERGKEFLCAEFRQVDATGARRRTILYLTAARDRFVKLRVTLHADDATDTTARNFADAVAAGLRSKETS